MTSGPLCEPLLLLRNPLVSLSLGPEHTSRRRWEDLAGPGLCPPPAEGVAFALGSGRRWGPRCVRGRVLGPSETLGREPPPQADPHHGQRRLLGSSSWMCPHVPVVGSPTRLPPAEARLLSRALSGVALGQRVGEAAALWAFPTGAWSSPRGPPHPAPPCGQRGSEPWALGLEGLCPEAAGPACAVSRPQWLDPPVGKHALAAVICCSGRSGGAGGAAMREKHSLPHPPSRAGLGWRCGRAAVTRSVFSMLSEATAPRPPGTASMEEAAEPDAHLVGPK